jgi:hypothetical protein
MVIQVLESQFLIFQDLSPYLPPHICPVPISARLFRDNEQANLPRPALVRGQALRLLRP